MDYLSFGRHTALATTAHFPTINPTSVRSRSGELPFAPEVVVAKSDR